MSDSDSDIWDSDLENDDMNTTFPIQDIFSNKVYETSGEFFDAVSAQGIDILQFIRQNSTCLSLKFNNIYTYPLSLQNELFSILYSANSITISVYILVF